MQWNYPANVLIVEKHCICMTDMMQNAVCLVTDGWNQFVVIRSVPIVRADQKHRLGHWLWRKTDGYSHRKKTGSDKITNINMMADSATNADGA